MDYVDAAMDSAGGLVGSTSEAASAGEISMLLLLVAAVLWSGHALHHSRLTFITEGSLALMWGLLAGGGFYFYYEHLKGSHIPAALVAFNYDIYMTLLLPPIIFYAGFSIKKKDFFANFWALTTLGVVGTILTAAMLASIFSFALHFVGLDTDRLVGNSIALGTIFSSSDSVSALQALNGGSSPQLHALVFGEAVVNDATAIVLLRAVQNIRTVAQLTLDELLSVLSSFFQLAILSMGLGAAVGLACSFVVKHSFQKRHATDHEVSLLAILGFLSYLLAEWSGLSGVFAAFFCGLTMSHYAWHSLSPSAKVVSVYCFRVLSFLAELAMFLSCGLDLWGTQLWHKDILKKKALIQKAATLTAWITVAVPLSRFAVALPLTALINIWRKPENRISWQNKLALGWAGCARGAVTLALCVNHFLGSGSKDAGHITEENRIIAAASMAAIVLSTVILGGATPTIFQRLGVVKKGAVQDNQDPSQQQEEEEDNEKKQYDRPDSPGTTIAGAGSDMFGILVPLMGAQQVVDEAQHAQQGMAIPSQRRRALLAVDENAEEQDATVGSLHTQWTRLDRRLLQPLFGGRSMSIRSPEGSPQSPEGFWSDDLYDRQDLGLASSAAAFFKPVQQGGGPSAGVRPDGDRGGGSFRGFAAPKNEEIDAVDVERGTGTSIAGVFQGDAAGTSQQGMFGSEVAMESPFESQDASSIARPTSPQPGFSIPRTMGAQSGTVEGAMLPRSGSARSSFRRSSEAAGGSMRRGSVDDVVSKMFSHPGDHIGEAAVDREVEMEGLVKQAENFLES